MKKLFELNKNLFKVGDNYVCVDKFTEIKKNLIVLCEDKIIKITKLIGSNVLFHRIIGTDINTNKEYSFHASMCRGKISFSTKFIHESIPVLCIESEEAALS